MPFYPDYRPSERDAARHVRATLAFGLLPTLTALALMTAWHTGPGPGLWAALGLGLGLLLFLKGLAGIVRPPCDARSALGRSLAASADRWFPIVLFGCQTAFICIAVALIWFTLKDLGFPASAWRDAMVLGIVVLTPAARIALDAGRRSTAYGVFLAGRISLYSITVLGTCLFVSSVLAFMITPGRPAPREMLWIILLLRVFELLAVLFFVILLLDKLLRRPRADAPPQAG